MKSRAIRAGVPIAFGTAAISGVSVFVNGYGVRAVPDATVYTTSKNLIAAVVLALLFGVVATLTRAGRRSGDRPPPSRSQLAGLAAVAVVGGSVPFVLFFEGLARASSTHASFIQKTLVVWVALLALPLLGERLRVMHVAAMGLIVGGLVALDGGLAGFRLGDGELLIFAATLMWAVEVILVRRLLRGVAPSTVALSRMGGGVLLLLVWCAATGKLGPLVHLGTRGWVWSLATGVLLAGYVATWFTALAYAQALDVTAILAAGAPITALLSLVVKGTPLPALGAWGTVLVTAGAALVGAAAWHTATSGRRSPALS
ncbi:MAG: DMT family transporter [Micromonosporaceae bacterium]|nr:DMT family transporter [Micromonosporaceae bacterium]